MLCAVTVEICKRCNLSERETSTYPQRVLRPTTKQMTSMVTWSPCNYSQYGVVFSCRKSPLARVLLGGGAPFTTQLIIIFSCLILRLLKLELGELGLVVFLTSQFTEPVQWLPHNSQLPVSACSQNVWWHNAEYIHVDQGLDGILTQTIHLKNKAPSQQFSPYKIKLLMQI